jgi:hypothetical protein
MAMMIADLEMTLHEMQDEGLPGMPKEQQKHIAELISTLSPGVDKSLRQRAIDTFNLVSVATDNGATLKEKPDGSLILNSMPDIQIDLEPAKQKPASKKPRTQNNKRPRK